MRFLNYTIVLLLTCFVGTLGYAQVSTKQPVEQVKKSAENSLAQKDSIVKNQSAIFKDFIADVKPKPIHYDKPKLSTFKSKVPTLPSPKQKLSDLKKLPEIKIDTSKLKSLGDSWLKKDWNFESDGKHSTLPPLEKVSLSDFRGVITEPTFPANTNDIEEDLKKQKNGLNLPGTLDKEVGKEVAKVSEQIKTQKPSVNNPLGKSIEDLENINTKNLFSGIQNELTGATKIYSEKALEQLLDSLGGPKFDSIFRVASGLMKKELNEEDFLKAFKDAVPGKSPFDNIDTKNETVNDPQGDGVNSLAENMSGDLSKVKLPQSVLSELPPVPGKEITSKYLDVLDSLRDINLKADGLALDEKRVTEKLKAVVVKEKPSFWDKAYFDGIVGFLKQGDLSIIQASPSLGYYFTKTVSIGLGPSILVEIKNKNWNSSVGLRSFLKAEFFDHRLYLQLEDNMNPTRMNLEQVANSKHSILFGVGGLIPLSKKMAINGSVLYRVNNDTEPSATSPWVFRLGFSSIKLK